MGNLKAGQSFGEIILFLINRIHIHSQLAVLKKFNWKWLLGGINPEASQKIRDPFGNTKPKLDSNLKNSNSLKKTRIFEGRPNLHVIYANAELQTRIFTFTFFL